MASAQQNTPGYRQPTTKPLALTAQNTIRIAQTLIGNTQPVGLAVSGGSDSMAMMMIMTQWAKKHNTTLHIATVDHSVSPNSRKIAQNVAQTAKLLGHPCDILTRNRNMHKTSQAVLRMDRYNLLCKWAHKHHINTLAVAHTADDLIETLWIRMQAGSNWFGLASPLPVAPAPAWPLSLGIRIIRPLLTARRYQLRNLLENARLTWHNDPANDDQRYQRTKIRLYTNTLDNADRMEWTRIWWNLARARQKCMRNMRKLCSTMIEWRPDGSVFCERSIFKNNPSVVACALLNIIITSVSGRPHTVAMTQCRKIYNKLRNSAEPFTTTLAGAWIHAGTRKMEIAATPQKNARTKGARNIRPILMSPGIECLWDGRFALTLDGSQPQKIIASDAADPKQRVYAQLNAKKISPMARRSLPVHSGNGRLTARALHSLRAQNLLTDPMVSQLIAMS